MNLRLDHIVLAVRSMDVTLEFYLELLGLAPERLEAFRAGEVPFPSARISPDTIIDFFPPELWAGPEEKEGSAARPNMHHLCLAMDEERWRETVQKLDKAGVAVEDGPGPRWGAHGTGVSVYVRDPGGNLVELRHYPAPRPEGGADKS